MTLNCCFQDPSRSNPMVLQNLSDLDFEISRSLKVKCEGAIELPTYGFLVMFNANIGPNYISSFCKI